ncbi:MAG: hypothetical protein AAF226_05680 [Verrucomicrobiota bacterium]
MALDYFERDLITIPPPLFGKSSLTIVPDKVKGANGLEIDSIWLMFLNRTPSRGSKGSIQTTSYRLVFTDPMTPKGPAPRLAIYRSSILPESGKTNNFLRSTDLHEEFWEPQWDLYQDQNGGRALLDGYLVEGVVDFKAVLNYTYQETDDSGLQGETQLGSTEILEPVIWTTQGFVADDIPTPNSPVSITISITTLNSADAKRINSNPQDFERVVNSNGLTISRTIPFISSL